MSSSPAMIVQEAHAPRISSAHTATNLDISSGGIIAFSLPGASHALDISTDDTDTITTLDSKAKKLKIKTPTLDMVGENGGFTATKNFAIEAGEVIGEKSTLAASSTNLVLETHVNGGSVQLSNTQARLSTDETAIGMADKRSIMYRSPKHIFQVGGGDIITMRDDKVTFHVDVEIEGAFNSISGDQTILQVEDPVIQLATGLDTEADIVGRPTGIQIDTVPADSSSVAFVSKFKAPDGSALFVDGNGAVDVAKASSSGVFTKQVALATNGGAKAAAQRTADSRLTEPAWEITGGQMKLVHAAPDAAVDGRVNVYAMIMRVTDEGYFEVGRLKQEMDYDIGTGTYAGAAPSFALMQECM